MPSIPITTIEDTAIKPENSWYQPNTPAPRPRVKFLKLPTCYSFDLDRLLNELKSIQNIAPFKPFPFGKKLRRSYQGIGLTHRKGATDVYYDSFQMLSSKQTVDPVEYFSSEKQVRLNETTFTEKNNLWTGYLGEVLNTFESPKTKVRLLKMSPKGAMPSHIDFPHYEQIKVHAYLKTNSKVWIQVEDETFQIPADGNFYWFDTGRYHAVWNDGDTDRIDLCVNLRLFYDHNGKVLRPISQDLTKIILNEKI